MADIIFPDATLSLWYADLQAAGHTFTARLASNNVTPSLSTVLGDFVEATYAGYAAQVMGGWSIPALDPATHLEIAGWAVVTFPNPAAGTSNVFCVYVTDEGGHLRFALRLDAAPVVLVAGGVQLSIDLLADLSSRLF
jgi:hypothetical protein